MGEDWDSLKRYFWRIVIWFRQFNGIAVRSFDGRGESDSLAFVGEEVMAEGLKNCGQVVGAGGSVPASEFSIPAKFLMVEGFTGRFVTIRGVSMKFHKFSSGDFADFFIGIAEENVGTGEDIGQGLVCVGQDEAVVIGEVFEGHDLFRVVDGQVIHGVEFEFFIDAFGVAERSACEVGECHGDVVGVDVMAADGVTFFEVIEEFGKDQARGSSEFLAVVEGEAGCFKGSWVDFVGLVPLKQRRTGLQKSFGIGVVDGPSEFLNEAICGVE